VKLARHFLDGRGGSRHSGPRGCPRGPEHQRRVRAAVGRPAARGPPLRALWLRVGAARHRPASRLRGPDRVAGDRRAPGGARHGSRGPHTHGGAAASRGRTGSPLPIPGMPSTGGMVRPSPPHRVGTGRPHRRCRSRAPLSPPSPRPPRRPPTPRARSRWHREGRAWRGETAHEVGRGASGGAAPYVRPCGALGLIVRRKRGRAD
jgi:hypothetical protein